MNGTVVEAAISALLGTGLLAVALIVVLLLSRIAGFDATDVLPILKAF